MSRLQVFLKVVLFHVIVLGLIFLLPLLKSCDFFPEKEQIITVDLSSLPPPAIEVDEDPPDEKTPAEEAFAEATPVPTPPPVPTPTATPQPEATSTPQPEATSTPQPEATAVPTSTPRPQASPTPRQRLLTPEEIRARINQTNPPPRATPPPAMTSAEIQRLIEAGLPPGGTGIAIGPVNQGNVNFDGVSSELYNRLFAAWEQPRHLSGRSGLEVTVSVEVLKNGSIGSSRITGSSGNAELDASVQKALSAVRFAKPLPASYSGNSRTFPYVFELSP